MKKNNIIKSKKLIKEDALETGLMIAGFIPVIGEIADIILIARYISKGEYIYAGLMLIALIPTIGDFIAKPLIKLLKSSKVALRGGDDLVKFLSSNPKALEQYKKLGSHLDNPQIAKLITQVEKTPVVGTKIANGMKKSIAEHKSVLQKISGTQGVKSTGVLSKTPYRDFFEKRALSKYMKEKGITTPPSNVVSYWWNISRTAKKDRRNFMKKVIGTSNLLDMFGLPSFEAFQNKIETDEEFKEKLANTPEFANVMSQTMSTEEIKNSMGTNQSSGTNKDSSFGIGGFAALLGGGALLSGEKGLKFLKALAKRVA